MMLTIDFFKLTKAQPGMYKAAAKLGVKLPQDHSEAIAILRAHKDNPLAQQLAKSIETSVNSAIGVRFLGDFTVNKYHVFNPMTGLQEVYKTESEAVIARKRIIEDYIKKNLDPVVTVAREISATHKMPDGKTETISAWENLKVDGDTLQPINSMTGKVLG